MIRKLLNRFCADPNEPTAAERTRFGGFCGAVGIACNLVLSVSKILIGSIVGSISVTADGLNNLSDMGSSLVTLVGFRVAARPADSRHPFGHGRMEYLSAFIVSMVILLVGGELAKSSISSLIEGHLQPAYTSLSLYILGGSALVKFGMFIFYRATGKAIDSEALTATASDSIGDVATSTAILLSVAVSMIYPIRFNLDAVMGLFVSAFILYSGLRSAKETLDKLLGEPPRPEQIEEIKNTILAFDDFKDIHDLIVHNYGPGRYLASVHVEVSQTIDIVHCHEEVDLCEKMVGEKTGIELTVHIDPIDTDDSHVAEVHAELLEKVHELDGRITLHDFRMTAHGQNRTNLIFDIVKPLELRMSDDALKAAISDKAREIDPRFVCVITVDTDFCGRV